MRLAKTEAAEKINRARSAGGLLGGAAVAGWYAGMCLVCTCVALLSLVMPVWAAALIMTTVLSGIGSILFLRGRARLRNFSAVPEQTIGTIKEDVEWIKQQSK